MFFKLILKGFKLKKLVVEPKKTAQPINWLYSSGRGPVEG